MKLHVVEIFLMICLMLVMGAVSFHFGKSAGRVGIRQQMQKQIIENNCGYHDPKTGEFTWGGLK